MLRLCYYKKESGVVVLKRPIARSDAERRYKSFHKWSQIIVWPLVLPVPVLSCFLIFTKDDAVFLVSAILLMLWTVVIIAAFAAIAKKRAALEEKLWEERNAIKRTGIFKELYEEFRHDGFEFHIRSDKYLFGDCHRNIIECAFLKNGHEFSVEIDENAVSILVDEETDHPAEREIHLSEIKSVNCFYEMVNDFVSEYSDT